MEAPRGNNILDLFFTSHPSLVSKCKPIPGVGDHDAVLVDTVTKPQRSKPVRRKIYLWDKSDLAKIKQEATCITDVLRTIQDEGIDSLWEVFRNQLLTILDSNVPHKNHKVKSHQPQDEYKNEGADSAEEPCFHESEELGECSRHKTLQEA